MILNDRLEEDEPVYIIEHYGKKGMKWGVRRDPKTGIRPIANTLDKSRVGKAANANAQRSMARSTNREKNKASRQKDMASFKKEVETARTTVKSGKAKQDLKAAKAAHAANKAKLGSREARKILQQERIKYNETVITSQQAKDGKEVAKVLLASVAAGVAVVAISNAITKGSRF